MIKCELCRFWKPEDETGECRRYAPRSTMTPGRGDKGDAFTFAHWPVTFFNDWCGEFQAVSNDERPPS